MASQSPIAAHRRVEDADGESADRRGWLSHGLAALAISALGLAIAGSVTLTSPAQDTIAGPPTTTASVPATRSDVQKSTSTPADPALSAFDRRDLAVAQSNRSAGLREALAREQAAQRAEALAKTAEDVTRSARTQSSNAREQSLSAAEQARRTTATQLAAENLRKAVAARVAAANARAAAEAADPNDPTLTAAVVPTTGGGVSPVPGAVIGAHFGQRGLWSSYHTGLDFRASYGTPIRAVKAGLVLYAGNTGDWAGNHVAIRHADGKTTMSSHMSSMAVRAGQTVQAGQVIGYVGQTGRAFGAHLHFELYPVGVRYGDVYKAVDPQGWLRDNGVQTR
ncbi:MAG TPA: M23 family metallopeptidase [Propionibacteriaceae bacterium]